MLCRNLPTSAADDHKANAQRNLRDPDSHILNGGDGWIQGYNCKAVVDGDHQIIVTMGFGRSDRAGAGWLPVAGTGKVEGQWTLMAITHNLLKLHRTALNSA